MKSVMFYHTSVAVIAALVEVVSLGQTGTAQADGTFICQPSLLNNDFSCWMDRSNV
jgi:hypothetical protein